MKNQKVVYATLVGDLFHRGHLEFIKKAKKLGDYLIIGLHPDDVVKRYKKREPIIPYGDRKKIIESIKEVDKVVEDCMDFREPAMFGNLKKYNVTIAVHGDDWLPPLYQKAREKKICKVIQVECYPYLSTTKLLTEIRKTKKIRHLLAKKKKLVLVSASDAVTAKLIEEAEFDGIWISGFEVSTTLGLTDDRSITMTEMLNVAKPIVDATTLPVAVDVDDGYGNLNNFIRTIKEFEKIGCSGICVEDSISPNKNSLVSEKSSLIPMEEQGLKIRAGKDAQKTKEFIIIARTDALIKGYGMTEAIKRAKHYVKCGADMVLIHSREPTGKEALKIPKYWNLNIPLAIVPTKFPQLTNKKLLDMGFSIIILANQTERIKIKAIRESLKLLKKFDSAYPIEKKLSAALDDTRDLIPIKGAEEIYRRYKCTRL